MFAFAGRGDAARFRFTRLFWTLKSENIRISYSFGIGYFIQTLPFRSVGNLLTVTAFELTMGRGTVDCTFIGIVAAGLDVCGGLVFAPTMARRIAVGEGIPRLLLID